MSDGDVAHRSPSGTASSWPTRSQVQAPRRGAGTASQLPGSSPAPPAWLPTCCHSVQRPDALVCSVSRSCWLVAAQWASPGAQDRLFRGPRRLTSTTSTCGTTGPCAFCSRVALCCPFAESASTRTDQNAGASLPVRQREFGTYQRTVLGVTSLQDVRSPVGSAQRIGADSSARAAAWSRFLEATGGQENSRRWLETFDAFDAAETPGPSSSAAGPFIQRPFLGGHFGPGAAWRHIVLGRTRGFDEEHKRRELDEAQVANSRAGARRASS